MSGLDRSLAVLLGDGLEVFLTLQVRDEIRVSLTSLGQVPGSPALAVLHQEAGPGRDQQTADVLPVVRRRLVESSLTPSRPHLHWLASTLNY